MLLNTGTELVRSKHGLLTTVCYKFGDEPAGVRPGGLDRGDRLGRAVAARPARHHLAARPRARRWPAQVEDNGGVYFVPAFSGLFAPYWRSDARGAIVGLSRFNTNAHLARATLEAICYQSRDVVEAMEKDSGVHLEVLKVDGGVTANELCMQIQADVLGVPVSRPVVAETTALGAAYAAGLAVGFWKNTDELRENWNEAKRWQPQWSEEQRATGLRPVEEGRRAHPGLGGRRLERITPERHSRTRGRRMRSVALSPQAREDALDAMAATELDVLVVGGGVVGAGAALDAATRGLSVGLVEARDFASRHVQPVQQADPRRPALPGDARLRAGRRGAARSAGC